MDFSRFQVLTFDCYGTLIDWETGLLAALRPIIAAHHKSIPDGELLKLYSELEARAEARTYRHYREVLAEIVCGIGDRLGFTPSMDEARSLPDSIRHWAPFPDTRDALRRLGSRYKLAIISNIDDELFAHTTRRLQIPFQAVVTAEQCRSYKPSLNNFETAMKRLGVGPEAILHCAESRFHDVEPARQLGIASVWVNRHADRPGPSASGPGEAVPDLEVPDMRSLADQAGV